MGRLKCEIHHAHDALRTRRLQRRHAPRLAARTTSNARRASLRYTTKFAGFAHGFQTSADMNHKTELGCSTNSDERLQLEERTCYARRMSSPAEQCSPPRELPITPSAEAWRAMSLEARQDFINEVNSILSEPPHFMSEGIPHHRAKRRATERLRRHFSSIGHVIFLAEELSVLYPGERPFTPDILAVRDVPEVEDDERCGWVVVDEGRGIDLAIEVLWEGDRNKDLVDNVERYARLGIPEYFVYDRKKQNLLGYHLVSPHARRYQRIIPQGGRHASAVLGLDLALINGKLEFFYGMSEIFGPEDLIARLENMMSSLEAKAADADARATVASLQDSVLAVAEARGIVCSEIERLRVFDCKDAQILRQWLVRVATAGSMAEAMG